MWLLGLNFPLDLNDTLLIIYILKYKTWHNI
jgi:hypothetical protein